MLHQTKWGHDDGHRDSALLVHLHGNPSRYLRHGVPRNVPILSDRGERAVKWPARVLRDTSGFVGFQCSQGDLQHATSQPRVLLHALRRNAGRVRQNRELIAAERCRTENIDDVKCVNS